MLDILGANSLSMVACTLCSPEMAALGKGGGLIAHVKRVVGTGGVAVFSCLFVLLPIMARTLYPSMQNNTVHRLPCPTHSPGALTRVPCRAGFLHCFLGLSCVGANMAMAYKVLCVVLFGGCARSRVVFPGK